MESNGKYICLNCEYKGKIITKSISGIEYKICPQCETDIYSPNLITINYAKGELKSLKNEYKKLQRILDK